MPRWFSCSRSQRRPHRKRGALLTFFFDIDRRHVALDQLRRHRVHRVQRRSPRDGRARVAHPVAGLGPRTDVAAAHRPPHVQPLVQRDHGGHAHHRQAAPVQFHVRLSLCSETGSSSVDRYYGQWACFQSPVIGFTFQLFSSDVLHELRSFQTRSSWNAGMRIDS